MHPHNRVFVSGMSAASSGRWAEPVVLLEELCEPLNLPADVGMFFTQPMLALSLTAAAMCCILVMKSGAATLFAWNRHKISGTVETSSCGHSRTLRMVIKTALLSASS